MPDPSILWPIIGVLTALCMWLWLPRKTDPPKYMFIYARNIYVPKELTTQRVLQCQWLPGVVWAVFTRKDLRAAIGVDRYDFFIISNKD